MANFRGSYIIAYTPFTEGGAAIDHKGLRRFIDWQIDEGTHGLIALGSFGQFLSITDEERTAIVESFVGQAAGRAPVIVGTMDARTENAVRYSKEAEVLGADGIMVAPPYYYTPTDDEIFAYYKEISEAVSIPVMLYNNPFTTNVDMSAALVARLTKAFENVRYIKESSGFADRIYDIERLTGGVMNSFAGSRVYESLLMGAAGYVSPPGSYAPRQSAQMWESLASGDLAGGKMLSDKFVQVRRIGAHHARRASELRKPVLQPRARAVGGLSDRRSAATVFFAGDPRQGGRRAHGPDHAFVRGDPLDQPGEGRRRVVRAKRTALAPAGSAAGRSRLVFWIGLIVPIRRPSEFIRLGAWRAVMLEHHKRRATTPGARKAALRVAFPAPSGG